MPPVQIPEGYKKCRVGILYSESEKHSVESRNFALWLCGSLVNTGYVSVKLIAYNQEKVFEVPPNRRIRFIPYGQTKPQEAVSYYSCTLSYNLQAYLLSIPLC